MNDFLLPLYQGEAFNPGSTDVGDVSWECPTAQIHVAAWPNGCPGHSWQNVSCDRTSIGHKAAVHAGKVLCAAAVDLLSDPELLRAARTEFEERTEAGYTCPIPADAALVHTSSTSSHELPSYRFSTGSPSAVSIHRLPVPGAAGASPPME